MLGGLSRASGVLVELALWTRRHFRFYLVVFEYHISSLWWRDAIVREFGCQVKFDSLFRLLVLFLLGIDGLRNPNDCWN